MCKYMSNIQLTDPRKLKCIAYYKDPLSDTFGNLKQSALKAGFSESYARSITSAKNDWITENVKQDVQSIQRAEKNLRKFNDFELNPEDIETKKDIEIAKIQIDASKFILKTQAKGKYNDEEVKQAPNVQVNIINYNNKDENKTVDASIIDAEVITDTPKD